MIEFSRINARQLSIEVTALHKPLAAKKWNLEDLAFHAMLNLKTIQSMARGEPKYKSTIQKVADALGIPPDSLLPQPTNASQPLTDVAKPPRTLTLVMNLPADIFDESDTVTIVTNISRDASLGGNIVVRDVRHGSILIDLELDNDDDIELLKAAFRNGLLAKYGVEGIAITALDAPSTWTTRRYYSEVVSAIDVILLDSNLEAIKSQINASAPNKKSAKSRRYIAEATVIRSWHKRLSAILANIPADIDVSFVDLLRIEFQPALTELTNLLCIADASDAAIRFQLFYAYINQTKARLSKYYTDHLVSTEQLISQASRSEDQHPQAS
jgi:transcriptional regulator with XRE-family HTH domain